MTKQNYAQMLRVVGLLAAGALWCLSVYFSTQGFGFQMGNDMAWVGIVLALVMTVLQIIWNHEAKNANITIFIVGLLSYIYGIWANIVGILGLHQETGTKALVFAVLLGLFVEIVPEPILVWSITGEWSTGDFISNIINLNGNQKSSAKPQQHRNTQKRQIDRSEIENMLKERGLKQVQRPNVSKR